MEVTLCITLDSLVNLVNKCCPISCPLKGGAYDVPQYEEIYVDR